MDCDSATFGDDPAPNVVKLCHVSDALYTSCAVEGGTCTFPGTRDVRYGANGQWVSVMATGSVACDAAAFGRDPLPNVVKTCEYR